MLLAVRVSSYGCTREVGEHERNELLEAQQRVTIASSRTLSMNQFFKVSVHILPISELPQQRHDLIPHFARRHSCLKVIPLKLFYYQTFFEAWYS